MLPFFPINLHSLSENLYVVEGDSAYISIAGIGALPEKINLKFYNNQKKNIMSLKCKNEIFTYSFIPYEDTTIYQGQFFSNSFFNPWNEILTSLDTIFLLKRPHIKDINFHT